MARARAENPSLLRAAGTVTEHFFDQTVEGIGRRYDFNSQVGNKEPHAPLAAEQVKLCGVNEGHIRAVNIALKIVVLFTDDFAQLPLSNIRREQHEEVIAQHVVPGGISGHIDQLSIHQLMVMCEGVGKALELLNRDTGSDRHDDYCIFLSAAGIPMR